MNDVDPNATDWIPSVITLDFLTSSSTSTLDLFLPSRPYERGPLSSGEEQRA